MAIRDLQVKTTRVGKIRTDKKILSRNGKEMPARLDTFRFTSPARHLLEEIAALYGGEVKAWERANGSEKESGKQWEVISDAAMVPVFVPPNQIVDPFYEQWGPGVCIRRCDGVHDTIYDQPCDCDPENRKCKPTTRVSLMLADVPGLGVWALESHGIYFAGEMVNLFDTIAGISMPLPARLLLENRVSKKYNRAEKKVETSDYNVPVLFIDGVTSRTVQIGSDAVSQSLRLGQEAQAQQMRQQAAIELPRATAIEAAPATPPTAPPAPNVPKALEAIAKATTDAEMAGIRKRIKETGEVPELLDAWHARSRVLTAQRSQETEAARAQARVDAKKAREARLDAQEAWQDDPGESEALLDPTVNPETIPEPSTTLPAVSTPWEDGEPEEQIAATDDPQARKDAMMQLLGAAGMKKLKTADIDRLLQGEFDVDRQLATVAQMQALAAKLR